MIIKINIPDKVRFFRILNPKKFRVCFTKSNRIYTYTPENFTGEIFHWFRPESGGGLAHYYQYLNGELHGAQYNFHYNSLLESERNYKNGYVHGYVRRWDTNGKLWLEEVFKNDKKFL